ncbi:MAG: hypothetical protein RI907_3585, partial [Pseudomonadota bacterium]|jgi:methyl-accepting chemotaxis protein
MLVVRGHDQDVKAHMAISQARQEKLEVVKRHIGETHVEAYRTMSLVAGLGEDEIKKRREALLASEGLIRSQLQEAVGAEQASTGAAAELEKALKAFAAKADSAIDLATVDTSTGVAALQSADAERAQIGKALASVVAEEEARQRADVKGLQERLSFKEGLIAAFGLACGLAAFSFAWWLQKRVVADILEAVDAANQVAQGHFDTHLHADREDEIGQLKQALATMVRQLSSSISTVQVAALSIGQASGEIASGNLDLSRRTESTASQLQSTASSMDELTGTVRHTVDAARSADGLASAATSAARRGGDVMQQVVSNMAAINEASRKINEIIGVIDSIAFQTNILALNAAVEAARAGEQGKGFAVVASEVRSLAQRSANAAREIKGLIGTSTDRVEVGTRLVEEAGQSMADIVTGVERVTQIITEITSAAEQESAGIGQVNEAVTQLDQMTQQNAALVEQSAAAAQSLREQVGNLTEVVGRFRLAEH